MARAPKTEHAKAIRAFLSGRITKAQFMLCCRGLAYVDGDWLLTIDGEGWGWIGVTLRKTP